MDLDRTFLRSRVGRRIFAFFIISAVVPITAFAALSLLQVAGLHRERAEHELHQVGRAYGSMLFERLAGLEGDLAIYAAAVESSPEAIDKPVGDRFESLFGISTDASPRLYFGRSWELPALSPAEQAHVGAGKTVLSVHGVGEDTRLFMVRAVDEEGAGTDLLVAEVNPNYLWSEGDSIAGTVSVCVLGDKKHLLYCSDSAMAAAVRQSLPGGAMDGAGRFRWARDGTSYVSDVRRVFLGAGFLADHWTVVTTEPEASVQASLKEFSSVIVQSLVLAILVVAFLSVSQIRRSLIPLEKLMEGNRRLAEKDFDHQVRVSSGDEFESLADSFNTMASRLNWQFHVLTTMADIDRRILSTIKLEDILRIVLTRMPDVVPCDLVCMALVDGHKDDGAKGRTYAFAEHGADPSVMHEFELTPGDIHALLSHSAHVVSTDSKTVPHYLAAPVNMGAKLVLALPIAIKGALAAVVSLGYWEQNELSADDLAQARDFAHHVGVALSNAAWEERLYLQAHYDSLTGLPNRQLLTDRVQQALARADRLGGYVAVMFLDLDRFKGVNDSLGHAAGDMLLQETAKRLKHAVRAEDTVARLGGDEFVIVIPYLVKDQLTVATVTSIAKKVLAAISQPLLIEGLEVFVTGSIGIAFSTGATDSVEELLKNADSAMYHAKAQGKADYRFFSQELNAEAVRRSELEYRLHHAIEKQKFKLYYQPKVELSSGRIVGAEALLRWPDSKHGFVSPYEFVPLAEETGLISEVGAWALHTACSQLVEWGGMDLPPVSVSVNFSQVQFRRSNLVKMITNALKRTGADPQLLELEMTESVAMEDLERTLAILKSVRELGISVALDDFGTGYSSMRYLKQLPANTLKIDQSFVRNTTEDSRDAAIVTSSIVLAHSLGMTVVAEGVETEEQLSFLRHAQCEQAQGYLFSRPVPAQEFVQLLVEGRDYTVGLESDASDSTKEYRLLRISDRN